MGLALPPLTSCGPGGRSPHPSDPPGLPFCKNFLGLRAVLNERIHVGDSARGWHAVNISLNVGLDSEPSGCPLHPSLALPGGVSSFQF